MTQPKCGGIILISTGCADKTEDVMAENHSLINDEMSEMIISATAEMATEDGAHNITVRKILRKLEISNRVFYNRFRNIDEVLEIVYRRAVLRMRDSLTEKYDSSKDFFEYILDVLTEVLVESYDVWKQFNQYVFEHDSIRDVNYRWWIAEIKRLIENAKAQGIIKDVDSEILSYSIWCFSRGYNADAICRRYTKEEAVEYFRYGMGIFLDGLKK